MAIQKDLLQLVDEDTRAFNRVMEALGYAERHLKPEKADQAKGHTGMPPDMPSKFR